jgi:hypothetical protein
MCNLYSITTNQEAVRALFRVINRYIGNLPPMPGVFPDIRPVVRVADLRTRKPNAREFQREGDAGFSTARTWISVTRSPLGPRNGGQLEAPTRGKDAYRHMLCRAVS